MNMRAFTRKAISCIMLAAMLYMHVCSVWCATGMRCTASKSANEKVRMVKSCCNKENKQDESPSNCQEKHVVFFQVTGQYSALSRITIEIPILDAIVSESIHLFNGEENSKKTIACYQGFHPPPPREDIRILIQSFLI